MKYVSTKDKIGCLALSSETQFSSCKHDHVIFTAPDEYVDIVGEEIEKRRRMAFRDTRK